jgi:hypothetical protein
MPPSFVLTAVLAGTDAELTAFVQAHLVPERFVLSAANSTYTTQAGAVVTVSMASVSTGDVTASVVRRDILTNGIVVQVRHSRPFAFEDCAHPLLTVAHRPISRFLLERDDHNYDGTLGVVGGDGLGLKSKWASMCRYLEVQRGLEELRSS